MRAIKILFIGLVLILGAALVSQKADLENSTSNRLEESQTKSATTRQRLPGISNPPEAKSLTVEKKVSAPPPLRAEPKEELPTTQPVSTLTRSGIILETNLQRQQNGSGFLAENSTLDATAAEKANDMCAKQYFAHVSPSGIGAAELADSFGYDYISIGENLALGPFASDAALVEAWMGSPGHRANILNSRFTEIGVGVTKCIFEGSSVWLAVQ
ncbi:MAG: CAP domain-containing protein, partial [Candidatus Colwellbacteria bacterium]|nr:CAP domain-containing protein [Candidatus Colwellbacteria bacterium]